MPIIVTNTKIIPKIIKNIDIDPVILEPHSTWVAHDYTRNCLARSMKYELILLCWDSNSKTPVHDHGGEDCWVYQILGSVEEIRFDNCLPEGSYIKDFAVWNRSESPLAIRMTCSAMEYPTTRDLFQISKDDPVESVLDTESMHES